MIWNLLSGLSLQLWHIVKLKEDCICLKYMTAIHTVTFKTWEYETWVFMILCLHIWKHMTHRPSQLSHIASLPMIFRPLKFRSHIISATTLTTLQPSLMLIGMYTVIIITWHLLLQILYMNDEWLRITTSTSAKRSCRHSNVTMMSTRKSIHLSIVRFCTFYSNEVSQIVTESRVIESISHHILL